MLPQKSDFGKADGGPCPGHGFDSECISQSLAVMESIILESIDAEGIALLEKRVIAGHGPGEEGVGTAAFEKMVKD